MLIYDLNWFKCGEDWTLVRHIIFQFSSSIGLIVAVLAAEVRNLWLLCMCQHFTWHCSCSSLLSEYIMTHTKSRSDFCLQVNHELIYTFIQSVYIVAILHEKLRTTLNDFNMNVHFTVGLFCLFYIFLFPPCSKNFLYNWIYYLSCQTILFMWFLSIILN